MWEHLDKNNLVLFPRPAFGRIPNFKGSAEAAAKLLELEEFKNAKSIEVCSIFFQLQIIFVVNKNKIVIFNLIMSVD